MTSSALAQAVWPGAVVVKHGVSLSGNGIYFDSYDSSDATKSTAGRYDAAKYSGNQGNLTSLGGLTSAVNLGNAHIYGTLHTGPLEPVSLGAAGGIGPHGSQVNDVVAARNLGYILEDANLTLPDTSLPGDYLTYPMPLPGVVLTASNNIVALGTNSSQYPLPPPPGGVTTNTSYTTSPDYPQPPPPGLVTNVVYTTSSTYPTPPPPGLMTNVVGMTNSPTLPNPVPTGTTTNTLLTTGTAYPEAGTYVGTIITNWTGGHNHIQGYTYNLITGYTYALYLYLYPVSFTYSWPIYSYSWTVYATNTRFLTNSYDYVLNANMRYTAPTLAGKTYVGGPNVTLVLPNGLTGAENLVFSGTASLAVYAGGTSAVVSASQSFLAPSPASLVVLCTPSVTSLTLSPTGNLQAVVMAPNADVRAYSGGSGFDFCGTLFANSLTVSGHYSFHFDEALSHSGRFPPQVTVQPQDQEVLAGQTATFSVAAAGAEPKWYQWMFQSSFSSGPVPIAGATNSTLVLSNTGFADVGYRFPLDCPCANYFVVVSNVMGSVQSLTAQLKLDFPPPQLGVPSRLPDGLLQLSIAGEPGWPCLVEGSTNLLDWVPLVTNSAPFTFNDPEAAGLPLRFYRVSYRP